MESTDVRDECELALADLRRLVQGIRTVSHAVQRARGITGAQLFVLCELAREPGASIRRLSERTLTDPSSVSAVIARLVERGLVIRTRHPYDRRKSALTVSKKGQLLLTRAPEPYQNRLIAVLRELPRAELRVLRGALSQLCDALGAGHDEGSPLFFEQSTPRRPQPRAAHRPASN